MSLEELRKEIDNIDDALVQLFARRMEAAAAVAEEKRRSGRAVLDSGRERDVLARVTAQVSPELRGSLEELYSTIFSLSRAYQEERMSRETAPVQDS